MEARSSASRRYGSDVRAGSRIVTSARQAGRHPAPSGPPSSAATGHALGLATMSATVAATSAASATRSLGRLHLRIGVRAAEQQRTMIDPRITGSHRSQRFVGRLPAVDLGLHEVAQQAVDPSPAPEPRSGSWR